MRIMGIQGNGLMMKSHSVFLAALISPIANETILAVKMKFN